MHERGRGAIGSQLVGERAKIILDEVRELSLLDRSQCLQHIGTSHVYRCSSFGNFFGMLLVQIDWKQL